MCIGIKFPWVAILAGKYPCSGRRWLDGALAELDGAQGITLGASGWN